MQPSKCVAWSPSGLEAFEVLLEGINYATKGVRQLRILLAMEEYVGGVLPAALREDRHGLDLDQR